MVNINKKVYDKIFNYAKESGKEEVGGLLLGRIQRDGKCLIRKAILLEQIRSNLGFEISDDDMMEFTKNAKERILKSVIGWWHSHGFSETCWSFDDNRTFTRLCNFLNGYCVGVVVNNRTNNNSRFRVDIKHKSGVNYTVDDIKPCVIGNFKINNVLSFEEIREIKQKVITDRRAEVEWNTCTKCEGSGIIFRQRYRNGPEEPPIENPSFTERMFEY